MFLFPNESVSNEYGVFVKAYCLCTATCLTSPQSFAGVPIGVFVCVQVFMP